MMPLFVTRFLLSERILDTEHRNCLIFSSLERINPSFGSSIFYIIPLFVSTVFDRPSSGLSRERRGLSACRRQKFRRLQETRIEIHIIYSRGVRLVVGSDAHAVEVGLEYRLTVFR